MRCGDIVTELFRSNLNGFPAIAMTDMSRWDTGASFFFLGDESQAFRCRVGGLLKNGGTERFSDSYVCCGFMDVQRVSDWRSAKGR